MMDYEKVQQDNEIIKVMGEYALIQREDGTMGYTMQQVGFAEIGDTVFESDIKPLERLPETVRTLLLQGVDYDD